MSAVHTFDVVTFHGYGKSGAATVVGHFSDRESGGKRARRMATIMDALAEQGTVTLADLSNSLGTSESTIRRDLSVLADQRLLMRTHGGARLLDSGLELPVSLRNTRGQAAKKAIAHAALSHIPHTRFAIGLSGGTTTAALARELGRAGFTQLRIVTNSLTIAQLITVYPQLKLTISGGNVRSESLELVGVLAENTFNALNLGLAILGADGISADGVVTTHDETEARTNRAMVSHAEKAIVLADGSKIGQLTLASVVPITMVDILITDETADADALEKIREAGVDVIQVGGMTGGTADAAR